MTQPPPPERGPAEEPARDSGVPGGSADVPGGVPRSVRDTRRSSGGKSASSGAPDSVGHSGLSGGDADVPGCAPESSGQRSLAGSDAEVCGGGARQAPSAGRDPRLAGFAEGGSGDTCPPSAALAAVVDDLSGPERRCGGASDEELIGLLGRWGSLEAWAAAGKLAAVRELIRRRARPGRGGYPPPAHGDLPDQWHDGLAHEVSAALGLSVRGADNLTCFAWDLQARLPGTGAALAAGTISEWKAKLISDALAVLDDQQAAEAEKLILDQVTGQPPGVIGKLAAQAVCTVDPDGAARRREHAEREEARVRFWRDNGGACALAAYGLPTDQALAANDAIETRARRYKQLKVRPGARLDQLRVLAFLDILNGITLEARLAQSRADAAAQHDRSADGSQGSPAGPGQGDAPGRNPAGTAGHGRDHDGNGADDPAGAAGPGVPDDDWFTGHPGDSGDGAGGTSNNSGPGSPGGNPGGTSGNGGGTPGGSPATPAVPALAARANLTLPLTTLLGLAERPGTAHRLGPLDPALVRDLAASAANSPGSDWCLTITDGEGVAVAHGCARPARTKKTPTPAASRDGPPGGTPWALTPRDEPGPPGGYGTWTLTLPRGRQLVLKLLAVPVTDCDHRHQSHGYQPSDTLRHLVQVRDGTCTFPTCSAHARDSDFEHAVPYHQGGKTCACNGAARSRRCHRVKQSPGWTVTQPRPGWHQWTTPSGRTYTQGPMRYPA
jgi:hypothetical protein